MPLRDLKSNIKTAVSVRPQAQAAGTVNGVTVDTKGYHSASAVLETGAATGSPTSYTLDVKVQESADNSTWSDVTGLTFTQITADDQSQTIAIANIGTARSRYLRLVSVAAFVGGTSPTVPVSAVIQLDQADQAPVS